jgi:phage FluMu protein Com
MHFNCRGCKRTIKVKGEPPAGSRIAVKCPSCYVANHVTVPAASVPDALDRFLDLIRKYSGTPKR